MITRPLPSKAEREALVVRANVDGRLEAARTRLETAELLLAGAPGDALLLCRELAGDLAAVLGALDAAGDDAIGALSRRCNDLEGRIAQLAEGPVDGAATSRVVGDLRALLRDVVKGYRQRLRTSLATRLDVWQRRVRIGVGVAALVALAALAAAGWSRRSSPAERLAAFDRDFEAGLSALSGGNPAEAAKLFAHANETLPGAPRSADAHNDLGWSLAQLGRYDEAIAEYETAIRQNPGVEVYRNNLELAKQQREAKRR